MSKITTTKRVRKGLVTAKRNLTPQECLQLQEMQRLVNSRKFEAAQVTANTALVADGQRVAQQLESIVALLDNAKNQWVAQTLLRCGYPEGAKCNINLSTGEIILTPHEPSDSTKTA